MSSSSTPLQETRCFDAVVELYAGLGEEDVLAGLWKRKGSVEESRVALAAVQHGYLPRAQNVLTAALRKHDAGGFANSAPRLAVFVCVHWEAGQGEGGAVRACGCVLWYACLRVSA